jgi:hypothetical protein
MKNTSGEFYVKRKIHPTYFHSPGVHLRRPLFVTLAKGFSVLID